MSVYEKAIAACYRLIKRQQEVIALLKKNQALINQLEWETADQYYSTEIYALPELMTFTLNIKGQTEPDVLQLFRFCRDFVLNAGYKSNKDIERHIYFDEALSYRQEFSKNTQDFILKIVNFDSPDCEVITVTETITRSKLSCKED